MAVAVDGWKVRIADSVGSALRGLFSGGDGVAPTLRASVAARCRGMAATATTPTTATTVAAAPTPVPRRRREVAALSALPYPDDALAPVLGAGAVRTSHRQHHAG